MTIHHFIVVIYVIAPVVAGFLCIRLTPFFRGRFVGSIILGLAIGALMEFAFAFVASAYIRWTQLLLTVYLAASFLIILKTFDLFLCNALAHLFFSKWFRPRVLRIPAAFVFRFAILFALGLPYVMAVGLTYRPKTLAADDPRSVLHVDYVPVEFTSSDGVRLSAWWIPSARPHAYYANRTIVLCPGLSANKSSQLVLVKDLIPECYNVLVLDFRAHGDSGGQLCTFGDLERRDVLAAVHWLRTQHPDQSHKIFGIGESSGAAALIAAAADPGPDGQAIAAIVAYSPYAHLNELAANVSSQLFTAPIDSWIVRLGLPMADVQTGSDLSHFSPADLVGDLWPRPILIVHSQSDEIVPWEQGDELYHAASFPKERYWLDRKTHKQTISDEGAARHVLQFLKNAEPASVI